MATEKLEDRPPIPGTLHIVTTTACNASLLEKTKDSPGVCAFCYRAKETVKADLSAAAALLGRIRDSGMIESLVFTGGEPLAGEDPFVLRMLPLAKRYGFKTILHTNGIALSRFLGKVQPYADLIALPIDGSCPGISDFYRGRGYFRLFQRNLSLLSRYPAALAFNTFADAHNLSDLPGIAAMLDKVSKSRPVAYWLVSQFRAMGLSNGSGRSKFWSDTNKFREMTRALNLKYPGLNIYSQPNRRRNEPYPFRVWLHADGAMFCDPGRGRTGENVLVGNVLRSRGKGAFENLMGKAKAAYNGIAAVRPPGPAKRRASEKQNER